MIFFLNYFDVSSRNFFLDVATALNRNKLVVLAMKDVDVAAQTIADNGQVSFQFGGSSTNYVVKSMPCSVMGVAEKPFEQECSQPVKPIKYVSIIIIIII